MNRERIVELEEEWLKTHPGGVKTPYVYPPNSSPTPPYPFPTIGPTILADGWKKVANWFVGDTKVFKRHLETYVEANPEHGFAITGVGQFQVYVSAYKRV